MQDLRGQVFGCQAMIEDITERKRAQEALLDSEERFRTAFDTSPDAISISRVSDGKYIDVNDGFASITGYTKEDVVGKSVSGLGNMVRC